jgi:hypothetical protein
VGVRPSKGSFWDNKSRLLKYKDRFTSIDTNFVKSIYRQIISPALHGSSKTGCFSKAIVGRPLLYLNG